MIKEWKFRTLVIIIVILLPSLAGAQTGCTVPVGALLTRVSVEPETGNVDLNWDLSPSSDIAAYIIYNHNSGYWYAIDTLWNPSATSYICNSTGTKYFSESYVVAALRLPVCTSPLSNVLSTICCTSLSDTCKKQITVKWNRYTAFPKKVTGYKLLVSKNGAPYSVDYSADSLTTSISISDFEPDTKYCYVVRAELEDGTFSSSNKSCIETKMQRPPSWINADYATVSDNEKIDLSFSYDPASEIRQFSLEKKEGIAGIYKPLAELSSSSGSVRYTDEKADLKTVNFYRLSAVNNCSVPVVFSNPASNISLSLTRDQNSIELNWNPYRSWNGGTGSVSLITDTGNGSVETTGIAVSDSLVNFDYSSIMYKTTGSEVCFRLEYSEGSNPYVTPGTSYSNRVCMPTTEIINVPNTFTPDGNLVNDTFKPVLSFTPFAYRLLITDIKRKIVFDTSDFNAEWDGTSNGIKLPEGPYLWFLKVTSPSGKTISRTGTVNIIFTR